MAGAHIKIFNTIRVAKMKIFVTTQSPSSTGMQSAPTDKTTMPQADKSDVPSLSGGAAKVPDSPSLNDPQAKM